MGTAVAGKRHRLRSVVFVLFAVVISLAAALGVFVLGCWELHRTAVTELTPTALYEQVSQQEDFVEFGELPAFYVNAVTAIEDRNFFTHGGVEVSSLARALLHNIKAGSFAEGGSTITMQTAKNLYYTQEKSITRKVTEIFTAFDLERELSKEQIFALYVNTIYFGCGYYGIGTASQGYYGIAPAQLTDEQCAVLAGVPKSPNAFSPANHPDAAENRAQTVLAAMEECGYI